MPHHNIHLKIENPTLARLISEQLATLKNIVIDENIKADCIITQTHQSSPSLSKPIYLVVPAKGTIRLGEILDRLGYLLSGRNDHVEDDNTHIDLGLFVLRLSENSMLHKETGDVIQLTDKERMLLRYLYQAGPRGINRKDLLKFVWGYADEAETHTLETHIYRLRQKLEQYDADDMIKVQDGRYMIINNE